MKKSQLLWGLILWGLLLAIIFIVPLVPLISNKTVEAPFLSQTGPDRTIVFFGYSACGDACPTTMMMLSNTLKSSLPEKEWPLVVFVDIDANSNAQKAARYAKQFNPHFTGYFPTQSQLSQLKAHFGLNFEQIGTSISHRGRSYFLQRRDATWYLTKAYNPQGFTAALLKNELL